MLNILCKVSEIIPPSAGDKYLCMKNLFSFQHGLSEKGVIVMAAIALNDF